MHINNLPVDNIILCIDAGNSNLTFARFENNQIKVRGSFVTEKKVESSSFEKGFSSTDYSGLFDNLNKVAIASVVPEIDSVLDQYIQQRTGIKPVWVNYSNCNNLQFTVSEADTVGADRIANAVAAREMYGKPVLVVDVGTATSFDYVNKDGAFAGGVIMPGPKISFDALKAKASKLSDIRLDWPRNVIGTNTAEAINSGVHYGHLYAVEGLVAAAKREVPELQNVVVTGGAGNLLLENSSWFNIYDPDLTLKGVRLIALNNNCR